MDQKLVKIGLVGKPSVGKSTFFKAATLMDVDIANYPFTTIDPNVGLAHVVIDCVDKELNTQCNPRSGFCKNHKRYVQIELIDVAGLVPGAHKGRGRGLAFLSDLNSADALIHVIDVSGSVNEQGEEVPTGSYDPANDIRFLVEELNHWYAGIITKHYEKLQRKIIQEKIPVESTLATQLSGLRVTEDHVKEAMKKLGLSEEKHPWPEEKLMELACFLREKTKPLLIAANKIDKKGAKENYERLKKEFPNLIIIPCSAEIELALREATKQGLIDYLPGEDHFNQLKQGTDKQEKAFSYIKEFLAKYSDTGVQQALNAVVFELLNYVAVYPGGTKKLEDSQGNRLPDCFLLPPKTTAIEFARFLHTDFEKHFIRAVNVKTKLPVAKDYVLKHRDVIEIISAK